MVIAKTAWFKKNKSDGFWGYKLPWQGTVYLIGTASLIFIGATFLPQNILFEIPIGSLFLFLLFDAQYASMKSFDERQKMHYSIAMRNMAWGMIITLILLSMILMNFANIKDNLGLLIIGTTIVGAIAGFVTRYKLEKEN